MPSLVGLAAIYRVSKKDIINVLNKFQNLGMKRIKRDKKIHNFSGTLKKKSAKQNFFKYYNFKKIVLKLLILLFSKIS